MTKILSQRQVMAADSKRIKALESKAKSARLRLLKERNENYLAEREVDDEELEIHLRIAD